jgi:hypothetical protein
MVFYSGSSYLAGPLKFSGGLVKTDPPLLQVPLEWCLRICISSKFSGDVQTLRTNWSYI